MTVTITAYDWVPPFARGQVRDLRVRWAMEEAGQPYDVRALPQGEQKDAGHRALQPFEQVPTYEEDGLVLFESGAIVLHVAERFGGGLLPDHPDARARATEWMFAAVNTVEPPVMDYVIATVFEAGEPWAAERQPSVTKRRDERLEQLSARLGDSEWLDGDFSAGDLLMVCVLRAIPKDGPHRAYPNLAAYVARGEARPAFARALEAQLADFTGEPSPEIRAWIKQFEAKQKQGEPA